MGNDLRQRRRKISKYQPLIVSKGKPILDLSFYDNGTPQKSPHPNVQARNGEALTGRSSLDDHNDYRAPMGGNQGIGSVVESSMPDTLQQKLPSTAKSETPSQSGVRDGDIVHTMSHGNCEPEPGAEKIVATLFCKSHDLCGAYSHPDMSSHSPGSPLSAHKLPDGAAPTTNKSAYPLHPLNPPSPDSITRNDLYGPDISQVCLTSFLDMLSNLQPPHQRLVSSHRCLDSAAHPHVIEITFAFLPHPNQTYLTISDLRRHESIYDFEREWNVEVIFQRDTVFRQHKRLAVFDMDSTLIGQEVIDEIAREVGVVDAVSDITARAMNGELDFSASLRARCALLAGTPTSVFETIKSRITLTPGAEELLRALKKLGYITAVLSGGFTPLASWLAHTLHITYAHANTLLFSPDGSTLTGEVASPIVNAERKRDILQDIAAQHGIERDQILAVGDGANDLLMLGAAGLGVAFNAKTKVQLEAPARLNSGSLRDLLYLLGFTKGEQEELCR